VNYLQSHGYQVPASSGSSLYSRDRNLWHLSHEGGPLENANTPPEDSLYQLSVLPQQAPEEPEEVEIAFEAGNPVAVNGQALSPARIVETLNALGGKHGIGQVDLVENRLVGMKSRGVYETPGGTLLYAAHQELESITLDRDTLHYKDLVAQRYAELVYFGQWFTPLREALDAFFAKTQECVTGSIKLKLYKGNVFVTGRQSKYSLYREDIATFGYSEIYSHSDAAGFIRLWGLPLKIRALIEADKDIPPVPLERIIRD